MYSQNLDGIETHNLVGIKQAHDVDTTSFQRRCDIMTRIEVDTALCQRHVAAWIRNPHRWIYCLFQEKNKHWLLAETWENYCDLVKEI